MEEAVIKRIMPHNTEAEQSVLGAMFMSRDAIMVATDILTGDDFYRRAASGSDHSAEPFEGEWCTG